MSSNNAVVFSGFFAQNRLTKVVPIPYPVLQDDKIIIKAIACAVNPTDWKHITSGLGRPGYIVGSDVSGIVEQVGKNVKGFEVGDTVSTAMHGDISSERGAFAQYVVADPGNSIKYDKSFIKNKALPIGASPSTHINTFEGAASVTLSLATAGLALCHNLGLRPNKQENSEKYILIWGGATVAGIMAIQIVKLIYGLKIITTASVKNHDFLITLGADEVFDYRDADVIEKIKKVGNGKIAYALDTVATIQTFQSVYDATEGSSNVVIDNLLFLEGSQINTDTSRNVRFTATLVYLITGEEHMVGDSVFHPDADLVEHFNEFWLELLPPYIKEIRTANLKVLSKGLESANEALELLRQNKVSCEKVVFRV